MEDLEDSVMLRRPEPGEISRPQAVYAKLGDLRGVAYEFSQVAQDAEIPATLRTMADACLLGSAWYDGLKAVELWSTTKSSERQFSFLFFFQPPFLHSGRITARVATSCLGVNVNNEDEEGAYVNRQRSAGRCDTASKGTREGKKKAALEKVQCTCRFMSISQVPTVRRHVPG